MRRGLSAALDYLWPLLGGLVAWAHALTPRGEQLAERLRRPTADPACPTFAPRPSDVLPDIEPGYGL